MRNRLNNWFDKKMGVKNNDVIHSRKKYKFWKFENLTIPSNRSTRLNKEALLRWLFLVLRY